MKKRVVNGLLLGLLLLTSCQEENKPGDAFMRYMNPAVSGHFEELAKGCCLDTDSVSAQNDSLTVLLMNSYQRDLEEKFQGLKAVEVLQDSVSGDGRKATLRVRLNFGNGQREETEYEMCLVNGVWKINLAL